MVKKFSKYLLVIICCLMGMMSVSAREMTLDELKVELDKISPDSSYIYVVGYYAFSSTHKFTREDNILAARSIVVENETDKTNEQIYDEMTVYRYDRNEDWDLVYGANMVGKTKAPTKFNIRYIDYVFIPDVSKANITDANTDTYKKLKDKYGIDFENDKNLIVKKDETNDRNTILSGEIYRNDKIGENVFPKDDLTGYYYAFNINVENLSNTSVVIIEGTTNQTYHKSDFDENGNLAVLMPLDPNLENMSKNIKVKVDLDGDGNDYIETTYTIDYQQLKFKRILDVNKLITDNMKEEDSDKLVSKLENGTLSLEQIGVVDSLSSTTGKSLIDALEKTLNTPGVKSIKLTYNGKDYELTKDNLEEKVAEMLADVSGKDYDKAIQNDVIGKSIKMTVTLEDGKVSVVTPDGKSSIEYTINFTGTKAEEAKFNVIVDKNDVAYTDAAKQWLNNLNFNFDYANLSLANGKLTGVVLENKKVGNEFSSLPEDITGYYFTYVIRLDENVKDTTTVILPANGDTKVVGKDSFDTPNSLVVMQALKPTADNKKFEITVDLDGDGKGYLPTTYVIDYSEVVFKKVLDVDDTIRTNMKEEDSDELVSKLENGILSLDQVGVVDSLSTTTGNAIVNALRKTLNTTGVKSIKLTYNGKDYELTKDNLEEKVAEMLADVSGKDYDKAIQNDVIGKSIKMTVTLEDNTVTPDGKSSVEYTINFTGKKAEETKFNVNVDKKDVAYTDAVKEYLEKMKFDMLDTDLTLTNGKLTGTILVNDKVGNEFSSLPEDITGYYFTYVIKLDENVKDTTTVILPGNGSTKVVGKDSFDTLDSMVVAHSLNPNKETKTFDIIVDLDGDGKDYLPTTYTIDFSGVRFLTEKDLLELSSDNVEKLEKLTSTTTLKAENKYSTNTDYSVTSLTDSATKTQYTLENKDGVEDSWYQVQKDDKIYLYRTLDGKWYYAIFDVPAEDPSEPATLFEALFPNIKSVRKVASDEEGIIKLAVTRRLNPSEIGFNDNDKTYFNPENDVVEYVSIKDKKIVKVELDILPAFSELIRPQFNYFNYVITMDEIKESVTVPDSIVNSATYLTEEQYHQLFSEE